MNTSEEITKAIIALIISGLVGGFVKIYFDYKANLMKTILEKRMEAYMKFFKQTELFPLYPKREVKWSEVFALSTKFRDWYFEGNGLVLSTLVRDMYFHLQEKILVLKDKTENEEKLRENEYKELREDCSAIRSAMARELQSRENPIWYSFQPKQKA